MTPAIWASASALLSANKASMSDLFSANFSANLASASALFSANF